MSGRLFNWRSQHFYNSFCTHKLLSACLELLPTFSFHNLIGFKLLNLSLLDFLQYIYYTTAVWCCGVWGAHSTSRYHHLERHLSESVCCTHAAILFCWRIFFTHWARVSVLPLFGVVFDFIITNELVFDGFALAIQNEIYFHTAANDDIQQIQTSSIISSRNQVLSKCDRSSGSNIPSEQQQLTMATSAKKERTAPETLEQEYGNFFFMITRLYLYDSFVCRASWVSAIKVGKCFKMTFFGDLSSRVVDTGMIWWYHFAAVERQYKVREVWQQLSMENENFFYRKKRSVVFLKTRS